MPSEEDTVRGYPELNSCWHIHFLGLAVCLVSLVYELAPHLFSVLKFEETLHAWPEIWVAVPFILLALNITFFLIEHSFMGLLAVICCGALFVRHVGTYTLISILLQHMR